MMASVEILDKINSVFESTCLIPNAFSLVALIRATNTEAVSLMSTLWWFVYLIWATFYLWSLHQPISSVANGIMTVMYGAMVAVIVVRRREPKILTSLI